MATSSWQDEYKNTGVVDETSKRASGSDTKVIMVVRVWASKAIIKNLRKTSNTKYLIKTSNK